MEFRYRANDTEYIIHLDQHSDGSFRAKIGERTANVVFQRGPAGEFLLRIDDQRFIAHTATRKGKPGEGASYFVALSGPHGQSAIYELTRSEGLSARRQVSTADSNLTAQMPGQVLAVMVAEGEAVSEGQPLLVLEAMKMEMRVSAPYDGVVTRMLVTAGDTVERGQTLVEVSTA